jgi:hypothetical protein
MRERARSRQLLGGLLLVGGAGTTIILAFAAGSKHPPSQSVDAALAFLGILSQFSAAWVIRGEGRADPTHATQSVRRLLAMATRTREVGRRAEKLFEGEPTPQDLHTEMGILSALMSWMQEDVVLAIEDWRAFHAQAVAEAERRRLE